MSAPDDALTPRQALVDGLDDALHVLKDTEVIDGGRTGSMWALAVIMNYLRDEFGARAPHPALHRLFMALQALEHGKVEPIVAPAEKQAGRTRLAPAIAVQRGFAAAAVDAMVLAGGETAKLERAARWVAARAEPHLRAFEQTRADRTKEADPWQRLLRWREDARSPRPDNAVAATVYKSAVTAMLGSGRTGNDVALKLLSQAKAAAGPQLTKEEGPE